MRKIKKIMDMYGFGNYLDTYNKYADEDSIVASGNITSKDLEQNYPSYKAKQNNAKLKQIGSDVMGVAPEVLGLIGQGFTNARYENTADDLVAGAGTTLMNINGINTTMQNDIDSRRIMSEAKQSATQGALGMAVSGASAGSAFGPIGAAVGGILGGIGGIFSGNAKKRAAKRAIREAKTSVAYNNNNTIWNADSAALSNEYNKEYGWTNNQVLHGKYGIDDMKYKVNSMLAPGETVMDNSGNIKGIVPGKNPNKDSQPANLKDGDVVLTNEDFFSQLAYPIYAAQKQIRSRMQELYSSIQRNKGRNTTIAENAAKSEMNKLKLQYSETQQLALTIRDLQHNARLNGELPEEDQPNNISFAKVGIDDYGNLLTGVLGGIIGIGQNLNAKGQRVYKPNTYVRNIYAPQAIAELDALRVNSNPIMNQMVRDEAKANYLLNNSGGLSAAQKYIGRVANAYNTLRAKAGALIDIFDKNNQYRADAAKTKLAAGAQEASNHIQAMQHDDDVYAKGHAAKLQGQQMGIYNAINALQTYIANRNKYDMYKTMYALYRDDQKIKREAIKKGLPT